MISEFNPFNNDAETVCWQLAEFMKSCKCTPGL